MLFYIVSLLTSIEYISMFREICVGSGSFSSLVSQHIPPDQGSSACCKSIVLWVQLSHRADKTMQCKACQVKWTQIA